MPACHSPSTFQEIIDRLAAEDARDARRALLTLAAREYPARELAERMKEEVDRARYQDMALSLRWSDDIVALGELAGEPTCVALGYMAEALTLYEQGKHRESLARFDDASALFRAHGDEVGWARTQIGRIAPCRVLERFDEALARAEEARTILERAGDRLRVAGIDTNLAALLERMNRPAEALAHSQRALDGYRALAARLHVCYALSNRALLLWRLGRVREALAAHGEALDGYLELNASIEAAHEQMNLGVIHLALGNYAEAADALTRARQDLLTSDKQWHAAAAGLYLTECLVRLGRFRDATVVAPALSDEFAAYGDTLQRVQALVWHAHALAGLHDDALALTTLDAAAELLAVDDSHRAAIDVSRARLLLTAGKRAQALALLDAALPTLREAGLTIEAAAARIVQGEALAAHGRTDQALNAANDALEIARRESLDWLAAAALHLRGRVEMDQDDDAAASSLDEAVLHLERTQRRVAWDDRVAFGGTTHSVYGDALALALRRSRPAVALRYAERFKARALAEHLHGGIDIRPRGRDARSQALVDELDHLRDRLIWLDAARTPRTPGPDAAPAAVRWAGSMEMAPDAARIEQRIAEIWRELQASNPAYRGEAAALNLAADEDTGDESAERWVARVQEALGADDTALLEYTALGDDLVLFVLRAGRVHTVRLAGAVTAVQRLVALLRLNVERSAVEVARGVMPPALAANARGILGRLYGALLAAAAALLDGATRLIVVPHGAGHHVPFHALHDGARYLVESVEVSYAPCAGLLEHFAGRRLLRAPGATHGSGALALACSSGGALPHVVAESDAVVAAMGGRVLREGDATLEALRDAGDYAILHVAAHAQFRPDEPLFSALHLGDGRLTTLDIFNLTLNCGLVTLSACETALGVAGAGDELMGLSRAFLYAGAPALMLSLWKVEDRSTAALMESFYGALRDGATKAAALRRAQLTLLHDDGSPGNEYSAPYFWAPFGLIGHPGPL